MREHEKITHARTLCRSYGFTRFEITNPEQTAQLNINGICICLSLYAVDLAVIDILIAYYADYYFGRRI